MCAVRTRLACLLAVVVTTATLTISASAADETTGPRDRCGQLVAFYDRFGVSRSEHSDGARNHFRIRAAIDCERGRYAIGIAAMEILLTRKKFDIPAFIGPAPWYEPTGRTPLAPQ